MTTNGGLTTLALFNHENGGLPFAGLVQGNDGDFFGTTFTGGANNGGTVFRMTTQSAPITLYSFNFTNGANPQAKLVLGKDGNFYGTTAFAGGTQTSFGTVFCMTPTGELITKVFFNGTNGANPFAGLVEGSDGNFYGTTVSGGTNNFGTAFKMTANGELTTLVNFNGINGSDPRCVLTEGNDGNFYGTTPYGGTYNRGTAFKVTSNGVLTTLFSFNFSSGFYPGSGLLLGSDGNFYGAATVGGAYGQWGTIFRIVMPVSLNSRVSGNELVLSWPTNALGFTLQAAADLSSPVNWVDFTNAPVAVGGQFTVTNNISGEALFYRLRKP